MVVLRERVRVLEAENQRLRLETGTAEPRRSGTQPTSPWSELESSEDLDSDIRGSESQVEGALNSHTRSGSMKNVLPDMQSR